MRAGTRGALCVYVPYVLSASLEFLRAVARERGVPVSLLRMWCSVWAVVSCRVLVAWFYCGRGATLVAARETQRLPALRGSSQRAAAPATLFRPPGRPCRKESQTFGLIPFRILWIATAVGCQSTHARLRSPSRGEQPARRRQPAPRLQKLLEPETAAGNRPRVYKSSLDPETTAGNRPRVYKGSSSCPLRATGPQVWNRIFCPRPPQATGPASSKAVVNQKLEHLGTTSPTVYQPSPSSNAKKTLLSRHARRK